MGTNPFQPAEQVTPKAKVLLYGGWGTGKTHFLGLGLGQTGINAGPFGFNDGEDISIGAEQRVVTNAFGQVAGINAIGLADAPEAMMRASQVTVPWSSSASVNGRLDRSAAETVATAISVPNRVACLRIVSSSSGPSIP